MKQDKRIKNGEWILPRLPSIKDDRVKITDDLKEGIISMRKIGLSYQKIAIEFGCSWFAIYRICNPEKTINYERGRKRPTTKKDNNRLFKKKYKQDDFREAYNEMRRKRYKQKICKN